VVEVGYTGSRWGTFPFFIVLLSHFKGASV
jgi:hypothetical protein